MADGSAPPAFDPSQPFTGGTPVPEFDPTKPFTGGEPIHDRTFLDRAKDAAGNFLDAQARNVAHAEGSAFEHAGNAAREFNSDFTTPLAKPDEDTRAEGEEASISAMTGIPQSLVAKTRGIRQEIEAPFLPTVDTAVGLASRAAKVAMDEFNVPFQAAVGTLSPSLDLPLGELQTRTDPRYTKEELARMTPEEKAQIGEELLQNLAQIPLAAEGAFRVPKAHVPEVGRLGAERAPAAESAEPVAATPEPPGAPPGAAPQPTAPAPTPTPAAPAAAASYVPQMDLETNTYHVVGPTGRVGPAQGYTDATEAAHAAEMLNRGERSALVPDRAAAPTVNPELAPQPDLKRTIQVGDKTHAVELPDENHAALFDYGQGMERAMAGSQNENLDPGDIYKRFRPWVFDDFSSQRDVGNLAQDYLEELGQTRPDADGVIRGHVVVDPDEEANYVRQQRGIAPIRISAPADSMQPIDGQIVSVSPGDLKVDPSRFQYKASDEQGVTGDLSGAKRWEPALTNPITVWRDRNSQLWVVNGHQRTDLARRAQAAGQPDIQMPARVYNEADGYTPAYMRALGAIQNMAEGSGTSIDAAKVLRALPDLDEGKPLPMAGLNVARGVAKDAQGLAGLTDHGFGLVTNEILPPEYAAEVGRRIKDPAQQDAALNTLVQEKPENAAQARSIVDDMLNSGFLGGEQTNLFGTEQTAQSLFGERAKILDNAVRTLRKNKSVFSAAISGDETLSGAGNVLDREGNLKGKTENEQLIDHLGQATRKGPLSDALSQAARDLAGGQPVSRATSSFLAKARAVVKSGYDAESVPAGADLGGDGFARPTEADGQAGLGFADTTHEHEFDFQREYEKAQERDAHAERLAAAGQPVRFTAEGGRSALASPDIGGNGYRLTYFDDRGPVGHTVYNTPAEAIRAGMNYGKPVDRAGNSLVPDHLEESHPAFYSSLEREVDRLPQPRAPAAEWKNIIRNLAQKGVKPEEVEWSGVNEWLDDQKGPVSKADLLQHIRDNTVELHEVNKTGEETQFHGYRLPGGNNYREMLLTTPHDTHANVAPDAKAVADNQAEWDRLSKPISDITNSREALTPERQAALDKAWDEREALHRRMVAQTMARRPQLNTQEPFTDGHWKEPNVLAHIRMDDRVGPNGEKILHVDEIQSDWHQQGRKRGYDSPALRRALDGKIADLRKAEEVRDAARLEINKARDEMSQIPDGWAVRLANGEEISRKPTEIEANLQSRDLRMQGVPTTVEYMPREIPQELRDRHTKATEDYQVAHAKVGAARNELGSLSGHNIVPDAPFKSTWHELAMKRVLRMAAENGYDRVTWTKGDTQAARYDLSKHLSKIELADNSSGGIGRPQMEGPFEHGSVYAYDPQGHLVIEKHVHSPDELASLIGKEAAEKLLNAPAKEARSSGFGVRHRELTGLDLKVGGEGMKGFYDKILPNFVNKYAKKWGAKVEGDALPIHDRGPVSGEDAMSRIGIPASEQSEYWRGLDHEQRAHLIERYRDSSEPVHSVDVTPAMRESVMQGQALFENHGGIERTDQGDQYVMPGAERKAVQAAAARGDSMTSAKLQKAADFGLFGKPEPEQPGLFDKPKQEVLPARNAHQTAADLVKSRGRETGNEHLAAVDGKTGQPIGAVSNGDSAYVKVPDALMAKLNDPAERVVIHHNHPSGGALSMADVSMLARPGLDTVIAHTHDGETSRASLTAAMKDVVRSAANPDAAWSKLAVPLKRAWNSTFTLLQNAVGKGRVTPEEAAQILHESLLRAAHENGLLDYTTTHDISHLPEDVVEAAGDRASYAIRQSMKDTGLATDVRRSPEPVRPDRALEGLPGENGKAAEAAPARSANGSPAGPVRNPVPDKAGQFALLGRGFHEAPEVKELFERTAAKLSASRGPMRSPARVAEVVGKTISDSVMGRMVRRLVSPGSFDETARIAARGIRQAFGEMYVKDMQAAHALRDGSDLLDKMPEADRNEFAMAYEEGRPQATPELSRIADNMRRITTAATARLQTLGILEGAQGEYLGRIWKPRGEEADAATADKVLARLSAKKPLTGSKSFLKQRYYDTYRDALEAGLEPVYSNPIMTQLVKISEMNRYYAGTLVARGAKQSGLAKFMRMGEDHGDMMELQGPEFHRATRIVENADGTTTAIPEGAWYAPEGFARVINNFQSKGLKGTMFEKPAMYLRVAANTMNQFQLGLSFFHPMFTSIDASVSRMGIGIDQAMRGEFGKGAGNFVLGPSPTNWFTNLKAGDEMLKSILEPENATPEQRRLVDAFGAGGGRVFMQRVLAPTDEGAIKVWKSGAFGRAIQDAARKYPGSPIKATLNVLGRTLETTTAPIMDYLVPRQKLGVFSRLAQDWLESHPDATNTEFVAAMQDRWESVDNRLGQMVYDNLFWDKTLKDIAFLTTRSVGWNLGFLREGGRAAADTGKFVLDAASLRKPEWTHRMSYVAALTTYSMTMGAVLNYLFTSQGPQELKDYFYPRTGLVGRNGAPDRIQLPTYMKDVFAYSHDPLQTLANKQSPMLSFIHEAIDGHDYYGDLIANKDDPALKQFEDAMKFAASQFAPFSVQGTKRMFQERPGPAAAMGMFGFTPAPGYITNPAAEQKYLDREHKADVTRTRKHEARKEIMTPLRQAPQPHAAGGRVVSRHDHDRAAAMADPDPTDPQIEAGNYRKGHLKIHGLDVSIETAKGTMRRGVGKNGKPWRVLMQNHYGYVRRTTGADGEQVDCFIGWMPNAKHIFVVDQVDPGSRQFDEHKCMIGFPSLSSAVAAYRKAFSDGRGSQRIGNVRSMTIGEFKDWLRDGDTTSSIAA